MTYQHLQLIDRSFLAQCQGDLGQSFTLLVDDAGLFHILLPVLGPLICDHFCILTGKLGAKPIPFRGTTDV